MADYDRAIDIDPHLASAYFVRSLLKQNFLDDLLGAERDYDLAIALDPKIMEDG
jgi:hypothetical protein